MQDEGKSQGSWMAILAHALKVRVRVRLGPFETTTCAHLDNLLLIPW